MRLVAGVVLIIQGLDILRASPTIQSTILEVLAIGAGIFLLTGLWTPVSGAFVAALGLWDIISMRGDLWANILLVTLGAALAVLGPGAWSIDARLFGWKRLDLDLHDRKN